MLIKCNKISRKMYCLHESVGERCECVVCAISIEDLWAENSKIIQGFFYTYGSHGVREKLPKLGILVLMQQPVLLAWLMIEDYSCSSHYWLIAMLLLLMVKRSVMADIKKIVFISSA